MKITTIMLEPAKKAEKASHYQVFVSTTLHLQPLLRNEYYKTVGVFSSSRVQ